MDPQVMVQLSEQSGVREVADEAAAKLRAVIDALESADAGVPPIRDGKERRRR
jgi:hypothetical protein